MKIKKLLLTTTAVMTMLYMQNTFAVSILPYKVSENKFNSEAHAHSSLHLNICGWLDAQTGFRAQDGKYLRTSSTTNDPQRAGITTNNRNIAFDTAGIVRFEAKGKTKKGLLYVANIDISADINSNHNQNNNNFARINRALIYLQDNDMGRLELGNNDGAASTMLPTANYVAAATGGVGGDWAKYVVLQRPGTSTDTIFINPNDFHMNAGSLLDQQGILSGLTPIQKSRKITYYTPIIQDTGIQLGISYTPDASNVSFVFPNKVANSTTAPLLGYRDGFSGGISWKGDIARDNMVKVAVVGEYAQASKEAKSFFHDLGSVGVGLSHVYKDFSTAISYNYLSRSGLRKATAASDKTKKDNYVATLGFAYNIDKKTTVSVTGLMSEKWKNKFYNISLGAQYKLAPGLLPYAEVSFFNMKQKIQNVSARTTVCDGPTCSAAPNDIDFANYYPAADSDKYKTRGVSFIIGTRIAF